MVDLNSNTYKEWGFLTVMPVYQRVSIDDISIKDRDLTINSSLNNGFWCRDLYSDPYQNPNKCGQI